MSEFIRNFEPRLHIAEVQRYGDRIEAARIAPESSNLTPAEIYAEQIKILDLALERLEDSSGARASAVQPSMTMARSWLVNLF